ncbi:MAG TPA: hypothetical protein VKK31_02320 [Thermoanaerobaculia bacterium]|nr:hypothetical protein [Thermoanaerobaculia bacterium]
MTTDASPVSLPHTASGDLWRTILRVAWLSIGLGLVLEILLLLLAAYSGTGGTSPKPFVSDLVQKVSWSFIVCVGLAFGSTAGKARPGMLGRSGTMGLLGLISAPLAFNVARTLHKGVNQALGVAGSVGGLSPFVLAALKAVEYGVLGAALGAVSKRPGGGSLGAHLGTGAAIGMTFGAAILTLLARAAISPMSPVDLAAKGINEVLFPVGCALVLYGAEAVGRRMPE